MAHIPELDDPAIAELCRRHGVQRLRVFGSATRPDFDPDSSDIDFLLELLPETPSRLRSYLGLKEDLEVLLGRPVDLVMLRHDSNPYFTARALHEAETLYAA